MTSGVGRLTGCFRIMLQWTGFPLYSSRHSNAFHTQGQTDWPTREACCVQRPPMSNNSILIHTFWNDAEGGGPEKCSIKFRWKSAQNLESFRCFKEAGNLCDVTLAWDDGCLQCLPWKVKVVQIIFFNPTWVMLWQVFWNTKIANINRSSKGKGRSWRSGSVEEKFCWKVNRFFL